MASNFPCFDFNQASRHNSGFECKWLFIWVGGDFPCSVSVESVRRAEEVIQEGVGVAL